MSKNAKLILSPHRDASCQITVSRLLKHHNNLMDRFMYVKCQKQGDQKRNNNCHNRNADCHIANLIRLTQHHFFWNQTCHARPCTADRRIDKKIILIVVCNHRSIRIS